MLACDVFRGWRGLVAGIVAGALVVSLESSCADRHGKAAKAPAIAAAASGATAPARPAGTGAPSARFITRASVDSAGAAGSTSAAGAASPGSELIQQALAGAGAEAGEGATNSSSSSVANAGGNGVPLAAAERRVGVVRVIGAHGRFVLIETTTGLGGVPLGPGQELRCRGAASGGGVETATLKVSPERQAPYLVADVVTGIPQTGDVAYFAVPPKR